MGCGEETRTDEWIHTDSDAQMLHIAAPMDTDGLGVVPVTNAAT